MLAIFVAITKPKVVSHRWVMRKITIASEQRINVRNVIAFARDRLMWTFVFIDLL